MATCSVFLPEKSHEQRSLVGYSLWGFALPFSNGFVVLPCIVGMRPRLVCILRKNQKTKKYLLDKDICPRYNTAIKRRGAENISIRRKMRKHSGERVCRRNLSSGFRRVWVGPWQNMSWTVTVCGVLPRVTKFLCRGVLCSTAMLLYYERRRENEQDNIP